MWKLHTTQNFGHFLASSLVTLLTIQNVINPNTRTPEHQNTRTPKPPPLDLQPASLLNIAGLRATPSVHQVLLDWRFAGLDWG